MGIAFAASPALAQESPIEILFFDGLERFEPTVMRLNRLELLDPHVFVDLIVCNDATSAFNDNLEGSINSDGDGDGFLDSSPLLLFEPFAPGESGRLAAADGVCSAPLSSTECAIVSADRPAPFEARDDALCRGPLPDTTGGYVPAVPMIAGPCFTDRPENRAQLLGGIELELLDGVVAGSYAPASPDRIASGLLRGFVREVDAENVFIPADVPVIGGSSLAELLAGGSGNCASGDDRDSRNGESGWWFYLAFEAEEVAGPGGRESRSSFPRL